MASKTLILFPKTERTYNSANKEGVDDEDGEPSSKCETLTATDFLTQIRKEARAHLTADAYMAFEDDLAEQTLAIRIGATLLQYRIRGRRSASEVALRSGMSRAAAYDLEAGAGKRGPRISSVQKYLRSLDASITLFATHPDKMPQHITITADAKPEAVSARIVGVIRDMAGITQAEVERRLNSPGGLLSRIENQRQGAVTIGMIAKVARVCGVTIAGVEITQAEESMT